MNYNDSVIPFLINKTDAAITFCIITLHGFSSMLQGNDINIFLFDDQYQSLSVELHFEQMVILFALLKSDPYPEINSKKTQRNHTVRTTFQIILTTLQVCIGFIFLL